MAGPDLKDCHRRALKTATAGPAPAARNFVGSECRDVRLPDVLVSDRDTLFTSAFWTGLHSALGASPIYGSQHHRNSTSKAERAREHEGWPALVLLVEFEIIDSASPLATGYIPF